MADFIKKKFQFILFSLHDKTNSQTGINELLKRIINFFIVNQSFTIGHPKYFPLFLVAHPNSAYLCRPFYQG
jgi:hypothetical protein